jgi:putative transposase
VDWQTEDTPCGHQVVTKLKYLSVLDIVITCVEGLEGFPAAIEIVYPQAGAQRCIVHLVRKCLNCVGRKARKAVAAHLPLVNTCILPLRLYARNTACHRRYFPRVTAHVRFRFR